MKQISVLLTDTAYENAQRQGSQLGVTVGELCSAMLNEALTQSTSTLRAVASQAPRQPAAPKSGGGPFDVAANFPDYPFRSVDIAQAIVNVALQLPNVTAFRTGRGIAFRPRFIHIEYLVSFRGKPGVVVSIYGEPSNFAAPAGLLHTGRTSYSRARIEDSTALSDFLPFVRQAYERRYGKIEK